MKNYEKLAQLKVDESVQAGLAAQKRRLMLGANQRHAQLSPEQRDELFRKLFEQNGLPDEKDRQHRTPAFVYLFVSLGIILAVTVFAQLVLLP